MAATPLPLERSPVAPRRGGRPVHRAGTAIRSASAPHVAPARPDRPARAEGPASARRLRAVPSGRVARQVLPTWIYGAFAGTILALGVLGIVALNALAAESSFHARTLESDISDLTLRHDDLVAAVATLAAPGRVLDVATTQLGLIDPEQPGFLTLDPDALVPETPRPPLRLGE